MMSKRLAATRRRAHRRYQLAACHAAALARQAAEFTYKLGGSSPMEHPAMARYEGRRRPDQPETNGRLEITIYPNSQLGGDTAMISQTISGAMQMYHPADRSAGAAQSGLRHHRRRLRVPRLRPGLGRDGWRSGQDAARGRGRNGSVLHRQDLGSRLPPDHHAQQADQRPGRPATASRSGCRWRRSWSRCSGIWAPRRRPSTSTRSTAHCRPASSTGRKIRWC